MKYFIIVLMYVIAFINVNYAGETYDKLIVSDYGEYSVIPSNTLFAVDLAKINNAEYLSINIHISKDGEFVLYDNYYLKDNTNVEDISLELKNNNPSINDLNFADIKKLKIKYGVKDSKNKNLFENLFNIISLDEYVSFVNNLYKEKNKKLKFYVKISDIDEYKKKNIDLSKKIIDKLKSLNYGNNHIILEYSDAEEIKRVRTKLEFRGRIVYKILKKNMFFISNNNQENVNYDVVKLIDFIDSIGIFIDYVNVPLSDVILSKTYDNFFISSMVDEIKKTKIKILVYNDLVTKKFPDNFKNYREIALILLNDLNVDGILTDEYLTVKNILYYLKN
jgi:glycerophosphoryl diester phosphodiesterase